MGENPPEEYVPEHRADTRESTHGLLSNKLYDRLKFVALVVLPALSVLYLTVAPMWDLPKQEEVSGSIMAIDMFLGAILGISASKFKSDPRRYGGEIVYTDNVDPNTGEPDVALVMKQSPKQWEGQDEVIFQVKTPR